MSSNSISKSSKRVGSGLGSNSSSSISSIVVLIVLVRSICLKRIVINVDAVC